MSLELARSTLEVCGVREVKLCVTIVPSNHTCPLHYQTTHSEVLLSSTKYIEGRGGEGRLQVAG